MWAVSLILFSLSSLFTYSLKRITLPQGQIQLLNVYIRDIPPDGLCKWYAPSFLSSSYHYFYSFYWHNLHAI